jgi:hypothetical protein
MRARLSLMVISAARCEAHQIIRNRPAELVSRPNSFGLPVAQSGRGRHRLGSWSTSRDQDHAQFRRPESVPTIAAGTAASIRN